MAAKNELVKFEAPTIVDIIGKDELPKFNEVWTLGELETIRDSVMSGFLRTPTMSELRQFFVICRTRGLNPLAKEIYGYPSWDNRLGREILTTVVAIDAMRRIADETNTYVPGREKLVCDNGALVAAKVSCKKFVQGSWQEFWCRADYAEYCKNTKDGKPRGNWYSMPNVMLLKCAEARALRKGWPQQLKGLYAPEEMEQADSAGRSFANIPAEHVTHEPRKYTPRLEMAPSSAAKIVEPPVKKWTKDDPIPDKVLKSLPKPLHALDGVPLVRMVEDDLEAVVEHGTKAYAAWKAMPHVNQKLLALLQEIVAQASIVLRSHRGNVEPPPPDDSQAPADEVAS